MKHEEVNLLRELYEMRLRSITSDDVLVMIAGVLYEAFLQKIFVISAYDFSYADCILINEIFIHSFEQDAYDLLIRSNDFIRNKDIDVLKALFNPGIHTMHIFNLLSFVINFNEIVHNYPHFH